MSHRIVESATWEVMRNSAREDAADGVEEFGAVGPWEQGEDDSPARGQTHPERDDDREHQDDREQPGEEHDPDAAGQYARGA